MANTKPLAQQVKYKTETVFSALDRAETNITTNANNSVRRKDYTELRAYTGPATIIDITDEGIAGRFITNVLIAGSDNGGTLIVGADGRRWKRLYDGVVWADWFKAPADVDDTGCLQRAAAHIDVTIEPLYLKARTYSISSTIAFATPPTIVGASYSPPVVGKFFGVPYPVKGTVILCNTGAANAITINNTESYKRGLCITDIHILGVDNKSAQYGMLIKNCGWGGYVRGLVIERFDRIGLQLSQLQDTLFDQLEILDCGKDNVAPALYISDYSNFLVFNRLRLELNEYQMLVAGGFAFEFHGVHFEQGDYPGTEAEVGDLLRINRYPSIRFQAAGVIKFFGGAITGATAGRQMDKFGITAADVPHHIVVEGDCDDVSFIGTTLGAPYNNGKIINFSGSGQFKNCTVQNMIPDSPSAVFNNSNLVVSGNQFKLIDGGFSTTFFGVSANNSIVSDNDFICANSSAANKTAGAIIDGNCKVDNNRFSVNKYSLTVNNATSANTSLTGTTTTNLTGTVDLRKFNPNHILYNNTAGTLSAISGMVFVSEVRIVNTASGDLIITHGGNISCVGSVNATIPPGGIIQFYANPSSGVLTEVWRRV